MHRPAHLHISFVLSTGWHYISRVRAASLGAKLLPLVDGDGDREIDIPPYIIFRVSIIRTQILYRTCPDWTYPTSMCVPINDGSHCIRGDHKPRLLLNHTSGSQAIDRFQRTIRIEMNRGCYIVIIVLLWRDIHPY